jgi:hypothetical protein
MPQGRWRAVLKLLDFASEDGKFDDRTWETFDTGVARYLQHLFSEGGSKALASDTLNGIVTYEGQASFVRSDGSELAAL